VSTRREGVRVCPRSAATGTDDELDLDKLTRLKWDGGTAGRLKALQDEPGRHASRRASPRIG